MATSTSVPTLRAHARKLYRDKVRDWLDIRHFWRQRRLILNNPEILFDPPKGKHWKQPLEFAIYGILVLGFAGKIVGWGLEKTFSNYRPENEVSLEAKERVALLQQHLERIENNSLDISPQDLAEMERSDRNTIAQLEKEIKAIQGYEHQQEIFTAIATRWFFIWAAGLFAYMSKGGSKDVRFVDLRVAYLYIVSASYFWLNVLDLLINKLFMGFFQELRSLVLVTYLLCFSFISIPVIFRTSRLLRAIGHSDMYFAQVYLRVGYVQFFAFGIGQFIVNVCALIYSKALS